MQIIDSPVGEETGPGLANKIHDIKMIHLSFFFSPHFDIMSEYMYIFFASGPFLGVSTIIYATEWK